MKNILFLISDQMQRKSALDSTDCIMNNVRELQKDSVDFPNAHTVSPICSPARASLITGVLPHNHGMVDCTHTVPSYRADFDSSHLTLSQVLKKNGYSMSYYGKWHIERSNALEKYGFDEYETEKTIPKRTLTPYKKIGVKTNGYRESTISGVYLEDQTYSEEQYIYDKSMEFIGRQADQDKPFCAFISTYAPHDPYVVPKEIYDLYDDVEIAIPPDWDDSSSERPSLYQRLHEVWKDLSDAQIKEIIRCYYSSCTLVDMQVGRLIKFLKSRNLYNDTLIVFLSDHGDMVGAHGLFCKGAAAFEDVYKIPLLLKLPSNAYAGSECLAYTDTCDILPTVLEILDIEWEGGALDGKSIVPFIQGESCANTYTLAEFFGQRFSYTQRVVWSEGFKYVFNSFDYDELYDLDNDPSERVNLARNQEYSEKLAKLATLMWKRAEETGDTYFSDAQYFMHRLAPIGPDSDPNISEKYGMYNKTF